VPSHWSSQPTNEENAARRGNEENAAEKFKAVVQAYKVLSDVEQRRLYDLELLLRQPRQPAWRAAENEGHLRPRKMPPSGDPPQSGWSPRNASQQSKEPGGGAGPAGGTGPRGGASSTASSSAEHATAHTSSEMPHRAPSGAAPMREAASQQPSRAPPPRPKASQPQPPPSLPPQQQPPPPQSPPQPQKSQPQPRCSGDGSVRGTDRSTVGGSGPKDAELRREGGAVEWPDLESVLRTSVREAKAAKEAEQRALDDALASVRELEEREAAEMEEAVRLVEAAIAQEAAELEQALRAIDTDAQRGGCAAPCTGTSLARGSEEEDAEQARHLITPISSAPSAARHGCSARSVQRGGGAAPCTGTSLARGSEEEGRALEEEQLRTLMDLGFHAEQVSPYCDGETCVEEVVERVLRDVDVGRMPQPTEATDRSGASPLPSARQPPSCSPPPSARQPPSCSTDPQQLATERSRSSEGKHESRVGKAFSVALKGLPSLRRKAHL